MKNLKGILVASLMALAVALPASAQFRFGVKAGVAINKFELSQKALNEDNRMGFTGGVMAEFTVPIVGIGCDASVLYASRSLDLSYTDGATVVDQHHTNQYIDIPVNLKWKFGLPVVGKIVSPFITTGPDFSFLISQKNVLDDFKNAYKNKDFDFSWNVGAGLQIINKIQIAASYGSPIGKQVTASDGNGLFEGKNRCWTVTAAYLF